ncbi:hypothetical protein HPP92_020520 [Vanilla planifolia]|uniref:Uncharacterized protein n=1 Tax=Vanilla planifolia TaxID=51239 RepID=A0A835UGL9_VANPL|nr:hypothetical protein HPP92_020910 [Vanilla planifolia]KAG0462044.1 hypothetical protein HPP92_020520 [Vanilla planifolia]
MLSSKSKSGLLETSTNRNTLATPRGSKTGRSGAAKVDTETSPQQSSRLSVDRSPRSSDSKPVAERRSSKISTAPDKQPRIVKGSEVQVQLASVQEELKKVKERLTFEETEKARLLGELSDTKKAMEEVSDKLGEALLAQKKAEERSELDKFRADELEQSAIEAAQRREEEWSKELEDARNQGEADADALLTATHELEKVRLELAMTTDAKNAALSHADDAVKIAEVNAHKVEILSGEINRLKSLFDSNLEKKANETEELIKKLDSEAENLKLELEKAKGAQKSLVEMEALVKELKIELTETNKAESDAVDLVNEWKMKVELLESQLEEGNLSEKALLDSLDSLTKKLEENKSALDDAQSEVGSLRGKVEALELEIDRHEVELEESNHQLDLTKKEVLEAEKSVQVLSLEIRRLEEEKAQALNNEMLAASNVESLTKENNKLAMELKTTREDSEKAKKAMEGLTSALHEVSTETRDLQERFLVKQEEVEISNAEVEKLRIALKNTQEKYEVMLDEAKYEIACLKKAVGKCETELESSRSEWFEKELQLTAAIKNLEDDIISVKSEMDKTLEMNKQIKEETKAAEEEAKTLHDKLRKTESGLIVASKSVEEAKEEITCLKTRLLDNENELQSITQENDDLRIHETAASKKIKELTELLAEFSIIKNENIVDIRGNASHRDNGELSISEKEYDILPKTVQVVEDKVTKPKAGSSESLSEESQEVFAEDMKPKDHVLENTSYEIPTKTEQLVCEGRETMESADEELLLKIENNYLDQTNGENGENGNTSPTKQHQQQQLQKQKKALLRKFGSMLKKKKGNTK